MVRVRLVRRLLLLLTVRVLGMRVRMWREVCLAVAAVDAAAAVHLNSRVRRVRHVMRRWRLERHHRRLLLNPLLWLLIRARRQPPRLGARARRARRRRGAKWATRALSAAPNGTAGESWYGNARLRTRASTLSRARALAAAEILVRVERREGAEDRSALSATGMPRQTSSVLTAKRTLARRVRAPRWSGLLTSWKEKNMAAETTWAGPN